MAQSQDQHPKNQSGQSTPHDLVKPGSTMDPKGQAGAPAPQQGQQQGSQGPMFQPPKPTQQEAEAIRKHRDDAKQTAAEREKSNNPATAKYRQYDADAPGMHPGNLPSDRLNDQWPVSKGTRLDREDVTGNPGGRGVNPDAPANSINPAPDDRTGNLESINEPKGVEPPPRAEQLSTAPPAGQGSPHSINEPPGSTIGGNMTAEGQPKPDLPELVLSDISPDSAVIGGGDVALTVTGEGFDNTCVVVADDEEVPTTFVSATELQATLVMATAAGMIDVEVQRGEETSDVLVFEFTAAARGAGSKAQRKPRKATPSHKRLKKGKK